jgi:hypothetical protein
MSCQSFFHTAYNDRGFEEIWIMRIAFKTLGMIAAEPEWNPAAIKECDRACLVDFMNRYMDAIYKHDTKLVPPLALDVRMTENTGQMNVGEGMLWRSKVEPTTFNLIAADPVQGQVSLQARVKIQGRAGTISSRSA